MEIKRRLIDPYRLVIDLAKANKCGRLEYDDLMAVIADQPSVDAVVPAYVPQAGSRNAGVIICKECGCAWTIVGDRTDVFNYCPNCGE